jgi:hypothetical protein
MTAVWSPAELQQINAARGLRIASRRADGTLPQRVPIRGVSTGGQVYVRTWYRRDTGWFGQVLAAHRARIRIPGLEADAAAATLRLNPENLNPENLNPENRLHPARRR